MKIEKALKSYSNKEFLYSSDGRTIRILSEYLYPEQQFKKHKIKKTIVFFGSARIKSEIQYAELSQKLKEEISNATESDKIHLQEKLLMLEKTKDGIHYYEEAVKLSEMISLWSKDLPKKKKFYITSGGGPGIMEAANLGAELADEKSIGLNISLPFEQYPNQFISQELNFEFHYFFMRKFWFISCQAIVIFPGGFGTLDEMMELLTLRQTKKVIREMPIVLYSEEYWKKLINFEMMIDLGLISKEDLDLFHFSNTPEEAFQYLKTELSRIHKL